DRGDRAKESRECRVQAPQAGRVDQAVRHNRGRSFRRANRAPRALSSLVPSCHTSLRPWCSSLLEKTHWKKSVTGSQEPARPFRSALPRNTRAGTISHCALAPAEGTPAHGCGMLSQTDKTRHSVIVAT